MNNSVVMRRGSAILEKRRGHMSDGSETGEGKGKITCVRQLKDQFQVNFGAVMLI